MLLVRIIVWSGAGYWNYKLRITKLLDRLCDYSNNRGTRKGNIERELGKVCTYVCNIPHSNTPLLALASAGAFDKIVSTA